jgi:MoxR-like ATPase
VTTILLSPDAAQETLRTAKQALNNAVYGQEAVVEQLLTCLLAGGHGLLIGVPGLAKTTLVQHAGKVLGLHSGRVQCTPDLMPSDILGSELLEQDEHGKRHFRLIEGPIFCQLLMADEINRASPKTQSALLQAMQEQQVTLAGKTYSLPAPFHVLATQNPLEQEGTYPLPEAQLDRFLLQISLTYPSAETEKAIVTHTSLQERPSLEAAMTAEQFRAAQAHVRAQAFSERMVEAIVALVQATRPEVSTLPIVKQHVAWGCGPRAGQSLLRAACARAFLDGRFAPSFDDITALAAPVLRHRLALKYTAKSEGIQAESVIDALCQRYVSA